MDYPSTDLLKKYAEVTVKIGLNLQPGQDLILQSYRIGGVPIQSAPLIREIISAAYRAGARYVDVFWGDEQSKRIRYQQAPEESFDYYPDWQVKAVLEVIERGGALVTVYTETPGLLSDQPSERIAAQQKIIRQHWHPVIKHIGRGSLNWLVISVPLPGWAGKVFPDLPAEEQVPALWDTLAEICRLDQEDPVAAWRKHIQELKLRSDTLNQKAYHALVYRGPGTDLSVGLPEGHRWESAESTSQSGIPFTANIPTEEVFTLPDNRRTEGKVSSTRPLVYGGNVIDDFTLTFKEGKVVDYSAAAGEQVLADLLSLDEGSSRLGEVALVPHSSPISQTGLLFYNTLLDENASCHLALGSAYAHNLQGGEQLSDEEFAARGGNLSLIHQDFMMGSAELDVDGIYGDGTSEPVLRSGEWAFSV